MTPLRSNHFEELGFIYLGADNYFHVDLQNCEFRQNDYDWDLYCHDYPVNEEPIKTLEDLKLLLRILTGRDWISTLKNTV